jgi:hypothetical protein
MATPVGKVHCPCGDEAVIYSSRKAGSYFVYCHYCQRDSTIFFDKALAIEDFKTKPRAKRRRSYDDMGHI